MSAPAPRPPDQAPVSGQERRVATALFADLSGFSALSASLPPEELSRVIDPVLAGLGDLVAHYGGQVEKFAGDAVLALFGAPVAHDDDAERALRCAADMHAALPGLSRHPEAAALRLHIGVTTGPVLARHTGGEGYRQYAVLGDAVVLAQRLESVAPAGETYVGAATVALVGPDLELEALPPQQVKGRSEPVDAFRLLSVGDRAGHRGRTHGRLVGRVREAAVLDAALEGLADGRGGVLALAGEAGSGKTRLVEYLLAEARGPVVVGSAASYGTAVPYLPLLPWLRSLPEAQDDPGVAALLGGRDRARTTSTTSLAPEALRTRVRAAVDRGLSGLGGGAGTVAVCEDLHWADEATRDLLSWLSPRCERSGVLLVVTGRDPEQCRSTVSPPGSDAATVLELHPLTREDVQELAVDLLGDPGDDRLTDLLVHRSRGNPFFAAELLHSLHEAGAVTRAAGRWRLRPGVAESEVPLTVQAVLAGRIDALSVDLAQVLSVVATVADRASPRLAAAVLETSPEIAAERLRRLAEHGLMEPVGDAFGFRHELVREVASARLAQARRREVHVLAAEAVARLGGRAEAVTAIVAQHLYLAGARRLALPHLRAAAGSARAVFANAEAEVALQRAAESSALEPPDAGLADDLLALAEVRALQGNHGGAAETFAAAADAGGGLVAVAGRAAALRRAGRYDEALAVLDGAGGDADAGDADAGDRRVLDLERSWVLGVMGRREDATTVARAGLASSQATDRVAGLLELQLVRMLTLDGELDQARQHAERALPLVREDPTALVTAYRLLGDVEQRAGDLDRARTVLQEGLAEAHRTGNAEETAACLVNLGLVASAAGDHAGAAGHYERAVDAFAATDNPVGQAVAFGNRAFELLHLQRLDESEHDGGESLRLARATGNQLVLGDTLNTLALVAEQRGERDLARERATAAAGAFRTAGARAEADEADALLRRLAGPGG